LQPEDVAPAAKGDDYAADEGAKGRPDERSAEEEAQGCCAFRLVEVLVERELILKSSLSDKTGPYCRLENARAVRTSLGAFPDPSSSL
jgi:hypothetical protein